MGEKTQMRRRRHGQIAVFARAVSYVIYLTFPVHAAMMAVGFIHKDRCPADVRLPRFLFFGGLAGLMAVLLRIVLEVKWWHIKKTHDGINYDPRAHPGLSMVRTVMYIFILFVVFWNVNATSHVLSIPEIDFEDESSELFCDKGAYQFTIALVVTFDVLAGAAFLFWLAAIVAGICNPHFLVQTGYFPSSAEVSFNVKMKLEERKKRKSVGNKKCAGSKVPTPPPNDEAAAPISVTEMVSSTPTISVTPAKPSSRFNVVDLESGVGNSAEEEAPVAPPPATNRFTVAPALVVSGAKNIKDEGQNAEGLHESDNESTDEEEEDDDDEVFSPEEDRANMSIVRFGTVDSRRISTDYYSYFTAPPGISAGGSVGTIEEENGGSSSGGSAVTAAAPETKLDITNFPKGPLFESASAVTNGAAPSGGNGGEGNESLEEKCH